MGVAICLDLVSGISCSRLSVLAASLTREPIFPASFIMSRLIK